MNRKDKLLGFLRSQNNISLREEEIAGMLGVKQKDRQELSFLLQELCSEGKITLRKGRYSAEASVNDDAMISSIMHSYGISPKFSPETLKAVSKLPVTVTDISGRVDLRDLLTVTIDGADARDFDDAISLEKTSDGYRLYVHIADVTHYVKNNSPIDRDAFDKGTSCYFPDRVIPMLPFELSNGICSLNPEVDRLTLTTEMKIDSRGNVTEYNIYESVINSDFRLVYDRITDILESGNCPHEYDVIFPMLTYARDLCLILHKKRFSEGSIDFNLPEPKIITDNEGRVLDIIKEPIGIANQIIEEFMIICNRTVAEHINYMELPFVYRIHEKPDGEKTENFLTSMNALGHPLSGTLSNKKMQELLTEIKGNPDEKVINTLLLRSMMKAKYSPKNIGHFGLGAKYYCHFTSPIRRYPDLLCHRIVKEMLKGNDTERFYSKAERASVTSSEREEAAMKAEREVVKLKMCRYMETKVGEEFDAVISSVTEFGFFAELHNMVEGLVRVADLSDDYYIFDEKTLSLIGERTKKTYRVGDRIRIIVARVDARAGWIDFIPEGGNIIGTS